MTKFKPGLGKGLGALINPTANERNHQSLTSSASKLNTDDGKSNNILVSLDLGIISPNPYQPGKEFNQDTLNKLKNQFYKTD